MALTSLVLVVFLLLVLVVFLVCAVAHMRKDGACTTQVHKPNHSVVDQYYAKHNEDAWGDAR